MTKTAMPQLLAMPKLDVETLVSLQKANIETMVAAQKIVFDLVQTVAKKQVEMVKEAMGKTNLMFKGFDAKKQPNVYADEMKAAVEKAMADVKETVDLGIKAQGEVVELLVKRATANFEEMKAVAA